MNRPLHLSSSFPSSATFPMASANNNNTNTTASSATNSFSNCMPILPPSAVHPCSPLSLEVSAPDDDTIVIFVKRHGQPQQQQQTQQGGINKNNNANTNPSSLSKPHSHSSRVPMDSYISPSFFPSPANFFTVPPDSLCGFLSSVGLAVLNQFGYTSNTNSSNNIDNTHYSHLSGLPHGHSQFQSPPIVFNAGTPATPLRTIGNTNIPSAQVQRASHHSNDRVDKSAAPSSHSPSSTSGHAPQLPASRSLPTVATPPSMPSSDSSPSLASQTLNRASCHSCKSSKDHESLMFCTNRHSAEAVQRQGRARKGKQECHKKYCRLCLLKQPPPPGHSPGKSPGLAAVHPLSATGEAAAPGAFEWWTPNQRENWICPFCQRCCRCSGCQRLYAWENVAKEIGVAELQIKDDADHGAMAHEQRDSDGDSHTATVGVGIGNNKGDDKKSTNILQAQRLLVQAAAHHGLIANSRIPPLPPPAYHHSQQTAKPASASGSSTTSVSSSGKRHSEHMLEHDNEKRPSPGFYTRRAAETGEAAAGSANHSPQAPSPSPSPAQRARILDNAEAQSRLQYNNGPGAGARAVAGRVADDYEGDKYGGHHGHGHGHAHEDGGHGHIQHAMPMAHANAHERLAIHGHGHGHEPLMSMDYHESEHDYNSFHALKQQPLASSPAFSGLPHSSHIHPLSLSQPLPSYTISGPRADHGLGHSQSAHNTPAAHYGNINGDNSAQNNSSYYPGGFTDSDSSHTHSHAHGQGHGGHGFHKPLLISEEFQHGDEENMHAH